MSEDPVRNLRVGQHVRLVEHRGCMAETKVLVGEGVIHDFVVHKPYGSSINVRYARVCTTDGALIRECPTVHGYWFEHDGQLEFHI